MSDSNEACPECLEAATRETEVAADWRCSRCGAVGKPNVTMVQVRDHLLSAPPELQRHAYLWTVAAEKVAVAMKDRHARGVSESDFYDLVFRTHDILSKEEQDALLNDVLAEVEDVFKVFDNDSTPMLVAERVRRMLAHSGQ